MCGLTFKLLVGPDLFGQAQADDLVIHTSLILHS